jgi:N4-gp56 family major capsid protein
MSEEIIQRAIDSNGFMTSAASADYINPEFWNKEVLRFQENLLVITKLGKVYNDLQANPGDTLNITVDAEPSVASDLTESTDVAIDALTFSQVQFTPTERGKAYQLHDKEKRRTFVDLMSNVVMKLGYALAKRKEALVISTITDGAGNSVVANGVTASNITTSDTIDEQDILKARAEIKKDKYTPTDLIISVGQEFSLLGNSLFNNADKYGGREAVLGGKIGMAFGVNVWWSDMITPTAYRSKALMLGQSLGGEPAFGIAQLSSPSIERQRQARGRYEDYVAVEDYDVAVLHANAICTIETYDAY